MLVRRPSSHASAWVLCPCRGRRSRWQDSWYLQYENKYPDFGPSFVSWVLSVIRWAILINGVIPISLYVTLEVVKVRA